MEEQELQQKFMEMQMLNQKIQQIHQQLEVLDNQLSELDIITKGLEDFKDTSVGQEVLVPFSAGIFAKAKLDSNSELLVNVGSGVTVKKSVEEVKELLAKQSGDLRDLQNQLNTQMSDLAVKAQQVENSIK